jgi:transposase
MYSVGIDLHKETAWCCVLDPQGHRLSSERLRADTDTLKDFFAGLPRPFQVAVEATYNWCYVVDLAEEYAEEVYLADSYRLKAFAKRYKKNDKIDARLIAVLLHRGDLPTVVIPDGETRKLRDLLGYRLRATADKTRNISRLKALLDKLGKTDRGNYNTKKKREATRGLALDAPYDEIVSGYLGRIERLWEETRALDKKIEERVLGDEDTRNLMSIPGIGPLGALLIKAEIFDIGRFRSFSRLCAYSGLAPRVHASGGHCHYGPLNRNRRSNLQWILLENVLHAVKQIPRIRRKYLALKKRKGCNTAKVAAARELLKIIYHVLKERRPYYPQGEHKEYRIIQSQSAEAPALIGV